MGALVEVSIPVDAEAAAALQDPLKRQALGRVISRWFQPENAKGRLLGAMDRLAAEAKAGGLTEEILNEELAAYNAERKELIVFDASSLVSATIVPDGIPRRAFQKACDIEDIALSLAVWSELVEVLNRPRLARYVRPALREDVLTNLIDAAVWVAPLQRVTDCRDAKDNKYLELALASAATCIVASDSDLLVLDSWRSVRILRPAEYLVSC